ncbi:MAG: restriction endonuclease subunit S [Cyclobacteriaceae bacterium]
MLEGLEISIFNYNDILQDNDEFRIDSGYYKKEYIDLYSRIKGSPMLVDLTYMSDLSTNGSFATVKKIMNDRHAKTIPFIRSGNCGDTFINTDDLELISEKSHSQLPKSTTQLHDIMMARKGKIGGASIITADEVGFNCSENVIKITIKNSDHLNPYYFTSYFNSKYGLKQIERLSTGNVQPWVSIFQIRKLMIPTVRMAFQNSIEEIVTKAHKLKIVSKSRYQQAEQLLLQEVGLADFTPNQEPVNIKSFQESFGTSGRLDAEYYQVKYEDLLKFIEQNCKWDYLKNLTTHVSNGNQPPYSDNGTIRFFSQKWIGDKAIDYSFLKSEDEPKVEESFFEEPKNKPSLIGTGDILYYSVGANLGYCHNYLEDEKISVGSFINIIRADKDKINEIYLGVVLNSMIGRLQGDKEKSGIAQPYIYAKNIREFKIPILPADTQKKIAERIWNGFSLKKQSENLLEVAKQAVEKAIEESEEVAMEFIKDKTKGL